MISGISADENMRTDKGLVMDVLMILSTIVFFLIAIAYTVACDKLK